LWILHCFMQIGAVDRHPAGLEGFTRWDSVSDVFGVVLALEQIPYGLFQLFAVAPTEAHVAQYDAAVAINEV
jgi:uncharacterized membrane protein YuzA (DUF378 family)